MDPAGFAGLFQALTREQLTDQQVASLEAWLAALSSDAAKAYRTFARAASITHEALNVRAGVRARGAMHLDNVNGWHSRFKTWLRRFNGVASRYLADYTGWQPVLDAAQLALPALWLRVGVAGSHHQRPAC